LRAAWPHLVKAGYGRIEILQIGMGSVACIAVVHTHGISKSPLTAQDIAENLDEMMTVADARVTEVTWIAR
jgi:hypothetical protein